MSQNYQMNKLLSRGLFGLILLIVISSTVVSCQQTKAWPSFKVTLMAPTFVKIGHDFTISASTNQKADMIELYVGSELKGRAYNTYSISATVSVDTIGKHTIRAYAYKGDVICFDREYSRARFDCSDPDDSDNLATDGYRHPNSITVYDAQIKLIQESTYSLGDVSESKIEWAEAIWEILADSQVAPWGNSNDWYTDIEMAEDYLDNNKLDSHTYACADYAVFISGLARAVGLPSRIWSIIGLDGFPEHMIAEVYITGSNINDNWLAMSIDSSRVNWETWADEDTKDTFRYAVGGFKNQDGKWIADHITKIWDIDYIPNPSNEQQKAWETIDDEYPNQYYRAISPSDFYGIDAIHN